MKHIVFLIFITLLLTSNNGMTATNQAPEINLPSLDGNIQLESLKGKVIYLDFWASWCLPCKKSFPWMHEIKQNYADQGFEIVAINLDNDRQLADEFLKEMPVNFKIAFDESGKTASQYKVKGMPSSYLIGRDGQVYSSHIGFREKDKTKLEQAIINLLKL